MDASSITTENWIATVIAGVGIGVLGVWKYLKELKSPTSPNGDRIIPGLSIADMQPIRDLATAQDRTALAVERLAHTEERVAVALEKMLLISQERAEDAEIVRRAELMAQEMLKQLQASPPRRRRT